ncbi:MAG: TadE/TadG family type IV pilus assembly protein [Chloroflexota bacterium]
MRALRSPIRRLGHQGGQGLVEFALILPVIVLVVFGLFDLGRGVFAANTLAQAARQASRTAIVDQDTSRVKAIAIANAPTLGLTNSNVSVCFKTDDSTQTNCNSPTTNNCPQATRVIGCLAIVTVTLNYAPMTPVLSTLWPSIPLTSTSIQAIEYVCPYATHPTCP